MKQDPITECQCLPASVSIHAHGPHCQPELGADTAVQPCVVPGSGGGIQEVEEK